MQPAPPAAPSVKLLEEELTPAGCGPEPAGRKVAGPAHAAHCPTPLTNSPALCAATPEHWSQPRTRLRTSLGPSAPAAAPVPWGRRRLSCSSSKIKNSLKTQIKTAWFGNVHAALCRTLLPPCPAPLVADHANCPSPRSLQTLCSCLTSAVRPEQKQNLQRGHSLCP